MRILKKDRWLKKLWIGEEILFVSPIRKYTEKLGENIYSEISVKRVQMLWYKKKKILFGHYLGWKSKDSSRVQIIWTVLFLFQSRMNRL